MAEKVAYLVELTITTRVVIEDGDNAEDRAIDAAVNKLRSDNRNYLSPEWVTDVVPDEDMPYDEEFDH